MVSAVMEQQRGLCVEQAQKGQQPLSHHVSLLQLLCQISPGGFAQARGTGLVCWKQRGGLLLWEEPRTPETMLVCLQPVRRAGEGPAGCGLTGKASEAGSAW